MIKIAERFFADRDLDSSRYDDPHPETVALAKRVEKLVRVPPGLYVVLYRRPGVFNTSRSYDFVFDAILVGGTKRYTYSMAVDEIELAAVERSCDFDSWARSRITGLFFDLMKGYSQKPSEAA